MCAVARGRHTAPSAVVDVSISKLARWIVGRRGGELWVWVASVGRDSIIRTSTSAHDDHPFDRVELDGIVVWFEQGLALGDVNIGWTPMTGFDVTWPGTIVTRSSGEGGDDYVNVAAAAPGGFVSHQREQKPGDDRSDL